MNISEVNNYIGEQAVQILEKEGISELRPAQEKAVKAGLFTGQNILVCTPTASGKTLIAEMASMQTVLQKNKKAVYIVPLIALANEKHKEFKRKYSELCKTALSIGDYDASDPYLAEKDLIICTAEKLDSLIRHGVSWISSIGLVVVDEIHLLNDVERGPRLEILITLLKQLIKPQILALSATIGNPEELADWLEAKLVVDDWRPVPLYKGVYLNNEILFDKHSKQQEQKIQ